MFTKKELKTIEALMVEALGNQKRAGYTISNQAVEVLARVQEESNGSKAVYSPVNEKGNEYIDGTYRLWRDKAGAIRLKLDKGKELYYISKELELFDKFGYLFEMYQRSQDIEVMEEADDEYRGADQE
jgi:hypothetical protein